MRVTFTCEKCGHYFGHSIGQDMGSGPSVDYGPCPACNPPEPTYGPLTVEMVAEGLDEVYKRNRFDNSDDPDWYGQARFVLRLVKAVDEGYSPHEGNTREYTRSWLLNLARGK